MTTQAKNRVLAYIVMVMLAIVAFAGTYNREPKPVAILIPKAVPVLVTVEEPSYDAKSFECMRHNVYHEAGNQSRKGMEAVALVTLNRTKTKHYPKSVCGVVKQLAYVRGRKVCQFSWHCDGKSDRPDLKNPLEREAWDKATVVAKAAMQGRLKDFLGRATHYHADYVNPRWARIPKRYRKIAVVGKHIFYRDIALKLKA